MNPISLLFTPKPLYYYPLIHSYIFFFYLFATNISCSPDPNFDTCQPQTCGNNQTITYPFYIHGRQEPFCGYPGFDISCAPNGFPILNLSNTHYIIDQIFYQNQSLRVSNAVFSISSTSTTKGCVSPTQNLTLPSTVFRVAPNQRELILFYGCDSLSLPRELQDHIIGCAAENETNLVVALYKNDENVSFLEKNCKGEVVDSLVEDGVGRVQEAVRNGFLLNWTASDCSKCSSTGGRCGFDSSIYKFRCYCIDRVHAAYCPATTTIKKTLSSNAKLGIALTLGVVGVAMLMILIYWFRTNIFSPTYFLYWRKNPTHRVIEKFLNEHGPLPTSRYSYSEVKKMTNSFKNKLGQGGYGCVYKGKLPDGRVVAVKILSKSGGGGEEFINEVVSISRTSHVNIVRLLGFCFDHSTRALIYEFMSNGSLEKFIHEEKNPSQVARQLDCKTLYDIAIGVARGLEYLHRGCNTRILHFDIKPHNILLDVDFCPKISDFGLAKICPRAESAVSLFGARGTAGYIAPEVFSRNFGPVSHKSDVYSYGMMILEMVGNRKNIKVDVDRWSEIYFPYWIYNRLQSNQELGLRSVRNDIDDEKVRKMTITGLWCIQTNPSTRPGISKVVEMLESKVESLQMPPKPSLFSPSSSSIHLSCDT